MENELDSNPGNTELYNITNIDYVCYCMLHICAYISRVWNSYTYTLVVTRTYVECTLCCSMYTIHLRLHAYILYKYQLHICILGMLFN